MPKKIKVVHIISGLGQGGAEQALFRLVVEQSAIVESIVVSLTGQQVFGPALSGKGIRVIDLKFQKFSPNFIGLFKLWKIIREEHPDVVQTWMYHADLIGGVVGRLAGVKKIFWGVVHYNLDKAVTSPLTRIVAGLCAKLSSVIPEKIVSCAYEAVNSHTSIGYDPDQFVVIPLGFDAELLQASSELRKQFRTSHNLSDQTIVFGCAARWHPQKDHANLISALGHLIRRNHDIVLILVGDGLIKENATLTSQIQENHIPDAMIMRLGRIENMDAFYSSLDLFILPSRGEAFPNVIAEAMSYGVPCIATDVGDVRTVIDNTGWIVPSRAPKQLAEAMDQAVHCFRKDRDAWGQRKITCRQTITERFSLSQMSEAYLLTWGGNYP